MMMTVFLLNFSFFWFQNWANLIEFIHFWSNQFCWCHHFLENLEKSFQLDSLFVCNFPGKFPEIISQILKDLHFCQLHIFISLSFPNSRFSLCVCLIFQEKQKQINANSSSSSSSRHIGTWQSLYLLVGFFELIFLLLLPSYVREC